MTVAAAVGGFTVTVATDYAVVPHVTERKVAAATKAIQAAGLKSKLTGDSGSQAWVWKQYPVGGTKVPSGSTVTLQLRTGPIP